MSFIQIIDQTTSRVDEVQALSDEFEAKRAAAGTGTPPRRVTITQDRDRPNHYLVIVEFESYDAAMENSNDPLTSEFAARMAELCDEPPVFYNLDVLDVPVGG
jgi:hypothetical protein